MSKLEYVGIEATYFGDWINLNDRANFDLAADTSLSNSARSWRKVTATSPVMDGDYLIHATLGMVTEQMKWWVRGGDQVQLAENLWQLQELFDQYDYRLRLTFNDYVETWQCQLADTTIERTHVYMHSAMAAFTASIPRFPDVAREKIA
jgi:hypothetical protein